MNYSKQTQSNPISKAKKCWSRYKGVTWNKRQNRWVAQIMARGNIKSEVVCVANYIPRLLPFAFSYDSVILFQYMKVRNAKISDAKAIYALINSYAEQDKMLFRSMADIYENLQSFTVAEINGKVAGCCALQIVWSDLAEIKSLAVDRSHKGAGVGKMLVSAAAEQACQLGLPRVFALTLEPEFFEKLGFMVIEKEALPMKVWSDCARCPKQQNCDEIAVIKNVMRDAYCVKRKTQYDIRTTNYPTCRRWKMAMASASMAVV